MFLVPQTAVAQGEQGARVMTVGADNKTTPRPVQAGEWQGKDWVILGGLKAGDKVIIDNLIKLKPGMPVKPRAGRASWRRQTGRRWQERLSHVQIFINRPIFASVISIIIVIAGLVALQVLPIAQYPQIARPPW